LTPLRYSPSPFILTEKPNPEFKLKGCADGK
jgi:hypothetical protein